MKRISLGLFTVIATAALPFQPVHSGMITCGVHYIQDSTRTPPTKYEVLKKCGEPEYREGDTWVYKKGGREREITFNNGKVASIR